LLDGANKKNGGTLNPLITEGCWRFLEDIERLEDLFHFPSNWFNKPRSTCQLTSFWAVLFRRKC
jgi:hypothetical protein